MKIVIEYESSWRNSFLDGSNNEPLPKKGRNFVSSMTELGKEENYHRREVTKDTVLGVLNRLIGDQRKLYQAREGLGGEPHYFNSLEPIIQFKDKPHTINHEITYIRNMKGSTDQNSYTGMIKANDPVFKSDFSKDFWGVLGLDFDELIEFILHEKPNDSYIELDPISILNRLKTIKKMKAIDYEGLPKKAAEVLSEKYSEFKPLSKGQLRILPMYCSALYMQLDILSARKVDMTVAKSKLGRISGISKNGFTPKDFMNKYTSGSKKLIYGNPYVREEYVKGEGRIKHTLKKVSGQLEIVLDIERDKSRQIKTMIENAGVSSFYLGKKGLAYVSDIRL